MIISRKHLFKCKKWVTESNINKQRIMWVGNYKIKTKKKYCSKMEVQNSEVTSELKMTSIEFGLYNIACIPCMFYNIFEILRSIHSFVSFYLYTYLKSFINNYNLFYKLKLIYTIHNLIWKINENYFITVHLHFFNIFLLELFHICKTRSYVESYILLLIYYIKSNWVIIL